MCGKSQLVLVTASIADIWMNAIKTSRRLAAEADVMTRKASARAELEIVEGIALLVGEDL
jgi:predicted trehalose synthase